MADSMGNASGKPLGYNATLVMQAIAQNAGYGFEIMRLTDLPAGTVYPLLRRLESAGHLSSRWESGTESAGEGRPQRRYYALTDQGERALAEARERLRRQLGLLELGVT